MGEEQQAALFRCFAFAGLLDRSEDHVLRDLVDTESRSYSGERFNRFIAELYSRIKALVQRCAAAAALAPPPTPATVTPMCT